MVDSTGLGAVWPRPHSEVSLMMRRPARSAARCRPLRPARRRCAEDLEHALGADAAGHALAAGFLLHELQEEAGHVHHAGVLVHHDQAARAHDRAELLQGLVVQRHVQVLLGDAAAGGPPICAALNFLAAGMPPPMS
jgi:hypothetical protein